MSLTAIFRSSLSGGTIDREKGFVPGVVMAELGAVARFSDSKGNPKELVMTDALLSSLLDLWEKSERADCHWTHNWITDGEGLPHRVATLRNFARDAKGNLIADMFVWPGEHREAILHVSEHDPKGMMLSMVFDYTGGRDNAKATNVRAVDLVGRGACTTALCSAILSAINPNNKTMEPDELIALLSRFDDKQKKSALAALGYKEPQQEQEPDTLAVLNAAGVKAEDSKPEDDNLPAVLRAAVQIQRATLRQAQVVKDDEREAILKEAEARFAKHVGDGTTIRNFGAGGKGGENPLKKAVEAQLSAMPAGKKDKGLAIMRALRDNPELEEFRATI